MKNLRASTLKMTRKWHEHLLREQDGRLRLEELWGACLMTNVCTDEGIDRLLRLYCYLRSISSISWSEGYLMVLNEHCLVTEMF